MGPRRIALALVVLIPTIAASVAAHPRAAQQSAPLETWIHYTNGNVINGLAIDPKTGTVWAATSGGAVRWDPVRGSYAKFTVQDGLHTNGLLAVAVDPVREDVWFGTEQGACRYTGEGAWECFELDAMLFDAYANIGVIEVDAARGEVWFAEGGCARGGLDGLARATRRSADGTWMAFDFPIATDDFPCTTVDYIEVDRVTGEVWVVVADRAAFRRESDSEWTEHPLEEHLGAERLEAFAVNEVSGEKWFVSGATITVLSRDGVWTTIDADPGLGDWSPRMAVNDATGETWILSVHYVPRAGEGAWLFERAELRRFARDHTSTTYPLDEMRGVLYSANGWLLISAMEVDDATGALWFGSYENGLVERNLDSRWRQFLTGDELAGNSVYDVAYIPTTGDRWLATGSGINRIHADGSWSTYTLADWSSGEIVEPISAARRIAMDESTGELWFSVYGGLARRSLDGTWSLFGEDQGLLSSSIWDLAIDPRTGDKWLAHSIDADGASRVSADGTVSTFSTEDGLIDNRVEAVSVDPLTGDRWFGTTRGVSQWTAAGEWREHRETDGLLSDWVSLIEVNRESGDVWLGGTLDGVLRRDADGGYRSYTTENSGLCFNGVTDMAFDPGRGETWFATWGSCLSRLRDDGTWDTFGAADGLPATQIETVSVDPGSGDVWIGGFSGGVTRLLRQEEGIRCESAIPIETNARVGAQLSREVDVRYYAFEVDEPFSRIDVSVSDENEALAVELFSSCGGSAGPGGGRHIGPGTGRHIGGEQRVSYDTTFDTGTFYLAIALKPPAGATPQPFQLSVSVAAMPREDVETLILSHVPRIQALYDLDSSDPLLDRWRGALRSIADHPRAQGVLVENVQTGTSAEVAAAYGDWLLDQRDPGAAQAVAEALRDWIWSAREVLPNLRYVVLAGDDRVLPHGRVSIPKEGKLDDGWVTEDAYTDAGYLDLGTSIGSALAQDLTLTDDVYGSQQASSWGRGQALYVPELAVGRLTEHPEDMLVSIDTYLERGGVVEITRTLTAGYDFMQDATDLADQLFADAGISPDNRAHLAGDDWTVSALQRDLFGSRRDLVFLAAHATHFYFGLPSNGFLRADGIEAAPGDNRGSLVYGLACHGGLSVPGSEDHPLPRDLAESWQRRGAAYIGSTGWAYGIANQTAYQESLMADFTSILVEEGPLAVGSALVMAKRDYHQRHELDHLHAKTLAGTILYGLPMTTVRIGSSPDAEAEKGRASQSTTGGSKPNVTARRVAEDVRVEEDQPYRFRRSDFSRVADPEGRWEYYSLSGFRPRVDAGEPIQPKYQKTLGSIVLDGRKELDARGVVLKAGTYRDIPGFKPLVERAGTLGMQNATNEPAEFSVPGWYPRVPLALRQLTSANSGSEEGRGHTRADLLINVGQFHAASGRERLFEELLVDEYYSASDDRVGAAVTAPVIEEEQDGLRISLSASDPSGIETVVVAYIAVGEPMESQELTLDPQSSLWAGEIPHSETYLVQVVDRAGNVTTIDTEGTIARPCVGPCPDPGHDELDERIFLPSATTDGGP